MHSKMMKISVGGQYLQGGFLRKNINSAENRAVVQKLVKEVRGLNPSYDAADIRGKMQQPNTIPTV